MQTIADNHGEPLLMSNKELYSVMGQINWTLKTQALTNMQIEWRPKSAGLSGGPRVQASGTRFSGR